MTSRTLLNADIRTQLIDSSIQLLQTAHPRIQARVINPLSYLGYRGENMQPALSHMRTDDELCYRYIDMIYETSGLKEDNMKLLLSAFRLGQASTSAIINCARKRAEARILKQATEAGIIPETPDTTPEGPDL